jgi:hypothetical protein
MMTGHGLAVTQVKLLSPPDLDPERAEIIRCPAGSPETLPAA